MSDPVALRVAEVSKHFATPHHTVQVLREVSFELARGVSLAITGPSGSGKSTLLHLIGTLDRPTAGTIRIEDEDPFSLDDESLARFRNARVGFVFQDHHLLPQYSVLDNVLLPTLAFRRAAGADTVGRARVLVEQVGLADRLEHRPAELSGGERQRVAVARALINRPSLLLCDEPTGSLDQVTATTVTDLLFDLHRRESTTLVLVTHSRRLAERSERRFELRQGRLAE